MLLVPTPETQPVAIVLDSFAESSDANKVLTPSFRHTRLTPMCGVLVAGLCLNFYPDQQSRLPTWVVCGVLLWLKRIGEPQIEIRQQRVLPNGGRE